MSRLWFIPATILAVTAGLVVRALRRHKRETAFTQDPVSSQWLAQARGREEQQW
jgi:cytochrome c-type biogenesis protein CcmH/NrfF